MVSGRAGLLNSWNAREEVEEKGRRKIIFRRNEEEEKGGGGEEPVSYTHLDVYKRQH